MLLDGNKLPPDTKLDCDLCVMGCGVAGTIIANELKDQLDSIIVLEAGARNFDPESQAFYATDNAHPVYPDPQYTRLRMLGGSSNHWENNTSPFDPIDFEKRDWVPNSGWPISFEDLAQYYTKAAQYCGAGDQGYSSAYWKDKIEGKLFTDDTSNLTTGISIFATPPVRFFEQYGDELTRSKSVRVFSNCNVTDVEHDGGTGRVTKAFFDHGGKTSEVNAKAFVMCFGGIENARMLLHFNIKNGERLGNQGDNVGRYFMDHPVVEAAHFFPTNKKYSYQHFKDNQYGEKSVSSYLKLNEESINKYKLNNLRMPLIPKDNYYLSDGVSSFHILKNSLSDGRIPDEFATHVVNFVTDIDMVIEGISRQTFSQKVFDHANDIDGFMIYMMMEQTPHKENRVKLGDGLDRLGIRKAAIDWKLHNSDIENLWRVLEVAAQDIGANGIGRLKILKERSERIFQEHLSFASHHMGTTRMSESASHGVVDKNHKVFGTKNFFIAGSSTFPTGGHVPPTLTIAATTLRLSEHIKRGLTNAPII